MNTKFSRIKSHIEEITYKILTKELKNHKKFQRFQKEAQQILAFLDEKENEKIEVYDFHNDITSLNSWSCRSYLSYQIVLKQIDLKLDPTQTNQLIALFLPKPLNKRQSIHCSFLISTALSLEAYLLLDCLSVYVLDCDLINILPQPLPSDLARKAPKFCSALISRGHFNIHQSGKENLSSWLQILSKSAEEKSIVLNHAIRYLFNERPEDYDLEYNILNIIYQKKCQLLNNHFLVDMASSVCKNSQLSERFILILIVASNHETCSLTNQLQNILKDKFSSLRTDDKLNR
ncbi:hypothetical protein NH340_JMT06857 [Sarcoptes scabiei]|nr:hypothetical protein NH340_JMT06857 [Sarcoptes scabiei]